MTSTMFRQFAAAAVLMTSVSGSFSKLGLDTLTVMHWNPHWQCWSNEDCSSNASKTLTGLLASKSMDFANVIELESPYTPPANWKALGAYESCGHPYGDWDTLFYNSDRWKLVRNETACMYTSRSFTLGVFESIHIEGLTVMAVGAHYPQTLNASSGAYEQSTAKLAQAIKKQWQNDAAMKTILMADTNTEGPSAAAASPSHHGVNKTNGQIIYDLGLWSNAATNPPSAPLFKGCCGGETPPFAWEGDRVIANFGSTSQSTVLFDPTPTWADFNNSEFHRGVLFTLHL